MFGKKKKLLAEIDLLKCKIDQEKTHCQELQDELTDLQNRCFVLEDKNQRLSILNASLAEKVTYYEKLDHIIDIDAQLKINESNYNKKLLKKNREIDGLTKENIKLSSALGLPRPKITTSSQNKEELDLVKLQNALETYSTTNATLNSKITDLEYEVEHYKQRAKENFQSRSEKDKENRRLRAILKLPKNTKLKCEHTVQYKIAVTTKSKTSALYNADIFIVNYSLYTFNDEGYCMKEIEKCAYFLERFYWTKGGYISFCDPALNTAHSAPQIFPDNIFRTYRGNDNKEYLISFSLDFIVEPTQAELLQFSVKKSILSSLLSKSKAVHHELKTLYDRVCQSVKNIGIDLPDQADILKDLQNINEQYEKTEKELKSFTKNAKEKFKSRFEKIK